MTTETTSNNLNPSQNQDPSTDPSKLQNDLASLNKRYNDTRSYTAKQLNDKDTVIADLQAKLTEAERNKLPSTDEDLANFAKEHPDSFNNMLTMAGKASLETRQEIRKEIELLRNAQSELTSQQHNQALKEALPDLADVKKSDDFQTWLKDQSPVAQKALSGDKDVTIQDTKLYLDYYKNHRDSKILQEQEAKQMKQDQITNSMPIESDSSVQTEGTGTHFTMAQINNMSDAEFRENLAKIKEQDNKGLIQ